MYILKKFNEIQNTKEVLKKDNYKLSTDLNDDHAFIFKDVDFSYINSDSRIFKNINFQLKKILIQLLQALMVLEKAHY